MWLLRLSWRFLIQQRIQSLLLVLGVALGTAVVIAVDLANQSARKGFELSTQLIVGKATHRIVGGSQGVPEELYLRLQREWAKAPLAPVLLGQVQLQDNQNRRLMGIDPFSEAPFRDFFPRTEMPHLSRLITESDTVVLSTEDGAAPPEKLELRFGARKTSVKVVGTLKPDNRFSRASLQQMIFADMGTAQRILGQKGQLSHIDVRLPRDVQAQWEQELQALLPPGLRLEAAGENASALQQMSRAFSLNLAALSLLALLVGMFLIYNSISFSVLRRRVQIGILRSLGVTRREIFVQIMVETLILAGVGILLGFGLGILLGQGMLRLVVRTINDLYYSLQVQDVWLSPLSFAKGLVAGLTAAVAAAAVPAWEATHTPPAGVLKASLLEDKLQASVRRAAVWGAALIALGVLGLNWNGGIVWSFACFFVLVLGATACVPLLTQSLMRLCSALSPGLSKMAPRNVARALSRSSVAIAALMVAISVVVSVNIMISSFRVTLLDWLDRTLSADIFITQLRSGDDARLGVSADLLERLRQMPEVARAESSRVIQGQSADYGIFRIQALSGDIARQRRYLWRQGDGPLWPALERGGVLVSQPFATHHGLTPRAGQTVRLPADTGEIELPVVGIYYDYSSDRGTVLLPDRLYRKHWDDSLISALGVFLKPEVDSASFRDRIAPLIGPLGLQANSNRELRQGAVEIFERTFAITGALRLLAVAVAFMGVLSSLMALLLERTREFGVLRALGFTRRGLALQMLYESLLLGLCAGLLALPLATLLSWFLISVINLRSFGWSMDMFLSPAFYVQGLLLALGAAALAGLYPAWRLARLKSAEALRYE